MVSTVVGMDEDTSILISGVSRWIYYRGICNWTTVLLASFLWLQISPVLIVNPATSFLALSTPFE
jgi:hypothetical protein